FVLMCKPRQKIAAAILGAVIAAAGLIAAYYFYPATPLKDGLFLKYGISLRGIPSGAEYTVSFQRGRNGWYNARMQTTGFMQNDCSLLVDRYFRDKNGINVFGPIGALLWINPRGLRIGSNVPAGEVIQRREWNGHAVYVIQDPRLPNCYGYYELKTGLQVGYVNRWSSMKLHAELKETNAKGL
ncbi:MAG: hypothetical protein PHO30_08200, partial [Candidatus Omnitrophica bacterium]|nr:hypothetical protein [Candidatus Omnitrophota bacterium]